MELRVELKEEDRVELREEHKVEDRVEDRVEVKERARALLCPGPTAAGRTSL